MNRVTRIAIQNLACFGDLNLTPGGSTLLLGANGTGKSTLFDVLFDLRALVHSGVNPDAALPTYQVTPGLARVALDVQAAREAFHYEIELSLSPHGFRELSLGPLGADWALSREVLTCNGETLTEYANGLFRSAHMDAPEVPRDPIPLVDDRSSLSSIRFRDDSPVQRFKAWADGIWLLRLEPRQMAASAEEPEESLAVNGENFVAWLLGYKPRKGRLAQVVASIGPSIKGLQQLAFVRAGREQVLVATFEGGAQVDFDALSDGQRCLIVLHAVIVFARKDCTLMLLDEPDAHVTPTEILPLFTALQERVERAGVQVIVASHHPQVIDLLAADSPWEMVASNGQISAEPFRVDRGSGVSASRHLLLRGRR